jgi:hypothetical protein
MACSNTIVQSGPAPFQVNSRRETSEKIAESADSYQPEKKESDVEPPQSKD